MFRKALFAVVMLGLCITFVTADTIKGRITKVDDKSVVVKSGKADLKAYDLAADCKFYREGKAGKEEIKGGARAEIFQKIPDIGLNATIETDTANKVKEVVLTTPK
jgi:phage terminase Nu1 subunit (DNA packaging protein)